MSALPAPNLNTVALAEVEWRAVLAFLHAQHGRAAIEMTTTELPTESAEDLADARYLLPGAGPGGSPDACRASLSNTLLLDRLINAIQAQTGLTAHPAVA